MLILAALLLAPHDVWAQSEETPADPGVRGALPASEPASRPAPPAPPPALLHFRSDTCIPSCRVGFDCIAGRCRSQCNPPCDAGSECLNYECHRRRDAREQSDLFAPTFVGFQLRPAICLRNCQGTLVTFGPEVGHKYVAFSLRYAYSEGGHFVFPDLRLYYEARVGSRFALTPFLEFTPTVATGGGLTAVQLTFRPGVRASVAVTPSVVFFFEPLALDMAVYTAAFYEGESRESSEFVMRYAIAAGIQARF